MSMPKGLAKATNYYNRLEAIRDWNKLATQVCDAGMSDLAAQYRPNDGDGWRKIDKKTAALREAFQQQKDRRVIETLRTLGRLTPEYPAGLLAARRGAFVAQVKKAGASVSPLQPESDGQRSLEGAHLRGRR